MYRIAVCLAVTCLIGLAGCAKLGIEKADLSRLKPDLQLGEEKNFSFAVIGDMHLADARTTAVLNRAVADINKREEIVFVVALGNIAATGQYKELNLAKSAFLGLNSTFYAVPGTADVDPSKRAAYENFETVFGELPWMQQRNGWALIGLAPQIAADGSARISEEDLEWLGAQIKRVGKDRPIALFIHQPLQPGASEGRLQNADDVIARFEGHPLRLVVSGQARAEQEEMAGETQYVSTGGLSVNELNRDGSVPGYRHFRVEDGVLTHEWVPVSG